MKKSAWEKEQYLREDEPLASSDDEPGDSPSSILAFLYKDALPFVKHIYYLAKRKQWDILYILLLTQVDEYKALKTSASVPNSQLLFRSLRRPIQAMDLGIH